MLSGKFGDRLLSLQWGRPSGRLEPLPDLPTVAESGYKDFEAESWNGVVAPAGLSKQTVSQLVGWFAAALASPEMKPKFAAQGLFPVKMCGEEYGALLRKQSDDYGRIIRDANIKGL